MAFEATGQNFKFKQPHCLAEGDPVLLCKLPESCNVIVDGPCVKVIKVISGLEVKLNVVAPSDTEGVLIKAADLQGFKAVARFGYESQTEYLNYGAACISDNQLLIMGCHHIPPGSTLTVGKAYPQGAKVLTTLSGTDATQSYTIAVMDAPAAGTLVFDDRKLVSMRTPEQVTVFDPATTCGTINFSMNPAESRRLPKGVIPWSLSIERGWDMTEFNRRHKSNCAWSPDWSQVISSGVAHVY